MTDPIHLTVYGTAQPQGSKSGFVRGGKVVMVEGRRPDANARFKDWRAAVADAARRWQEENGPIPLLDESVRIDLSFYLPRPKSAPKWKQWASTRPDGDKLQRAVWDALTGTLLADDSRVVRWSGMKSYTYSAPRAEIIIWPLGDIERRSSSGGGDLVEHSV